MSNDPKFRAAMKQGARDFADLPERVKWDAHDDLVLGCFNARDWCEACGREEPPAKGWRTGFADAADLWAMSIHG